MDTIRKAQLQSYCTDFVFHVLDRLEAEDELDLVVSTYEQALALIEHGYYPMRLMVWWNQIRVCEGLEAVQ